MSNKDGSVSFECPRCGAAGMLRIGQNVHRGKLRWYESTNCLVCGLQSEADGVGLPPDGIRGKMIENFGLWQVLMNTPNNAATFVRVFRDALGMRPLEVMRIVKSLPGSIYAGTKDEAHWLFALLSSSGESPKIERSEEGRSQT